MENTYIDAALKLLRADKQIQGNKERAMAPAVRQALEDFCRQDVEFAQAVAQGGSFADCMKAVARGVGGSLSDLEAFRRAVTFYFPGAAVSYNMRIDVCPNREAPTEAAEPVLLDLEAFL